MLETERLGAQLAQTISGNFMSATALNFAMGRLYEAVAQERISIRNANARLPASAASCSAPLPW